VNTGSDAPGVSVIMPFLDAGAFIEEAIESVLAQTMPAFELLLIDDGSKDRSTGIARQFSKEFPAKVRYFEHAGHANRGKSASRNLGIAEARGRYLTFLDADDVFLPHKLAHQSELLGRQPDAVMVYGATEYWRSWDKSRLLRRSDKPGKLGVKSGRLYGPPDLLVAWLRAPGIVPCICGLLARTAVVRATGSFDDRIHDLYEDQVFLVKMLMAGAVYVESGCAERYRQHAGSSSALAVASGHYHPWRKNPARLKYLRWLQGFLGDRGSLSGELQKALDRALRPYADSLVQRLGWFS
jgi:glycosyltransferase involved in cell wall biosynthesis